jgi:hypothetical protein
MKKGYIGVVGMANLDIREGVMLLKLQESERHLDAGTGYFAYWWLGILTSCE